MAFSQAVSGLNAAATNLDVIGNNIANSATYGFKSGTASFADMFAGSKVGLGVKVAGITQDFTDGTTTNTGRGLDVAISQNGFFRLVDSNGSVFYSRNGQFKLDENRNLVNKRALGWVLMNVAMRQEPFESRVCLRFAKHHARLSSVISFLQSQITPLSLDCRNMLPATWEGAINCTAR